MKKNLKSSNKKKADPLALFGKYSDFPLDPKTFRKDLWERKPKIDHTYLFGKWKDFDIDAKKLREDSWRKF